jgi:hypothetical protein
MRVVPPGQSMARPPAVSVPLNITFFAFWLMLMKPPMPMMRPPKRLTFTFAWRSTWAKDRNARSMPPPS